MTTAFDLDSYRRVARVREDFLSGGTAPPALRDSIVNSWARCVHLGVNPDLREIPSADSNPRRTRLIKAAELVMNDLSHHLADTSAGIVVADSNGVMVGRWVPDTSLLRMMDATNSAPGAQLTEELVGTNGLGTVLEDERPFSVIGHEHFSQGLVDYSCYGAPIVNPRTRRIEGVLTFLCNVRDSSPLMLPFAKSASAQIAEQLPRFGSTARADKQLLDIFYSTTKAARHPTVLVGDDFVLANRKGAEFLGNEDRSALWDIASRAGDGDPIEASVQLSGGRDARATVRRLHTDDNVLGTLIKVLIPETAAHTRDTSMPPSHDGEYELRTRLCAFDSAWDSILPKLSTTAWGRCPLLIFGEPGVGKTELADALHDLREPGRPVVHLHAGLASVEGTTTWMARVHDALQLDGTVVIQRINALDEADAQQLATIIEASGRQDETHRLIATYVGDPARDGIHYALDEVLAIKRVRVPSLRERPTDMASLLERIALKLDVPPLKLSLIAMQALNAYSWPGNLKQMKRFVQSMSMEFATATIDFDELPEDMTVTATGRTFGEIERFERQAIVNALARFRGNKSLAAEALGMSRATLYRKIRTYRLDRG